MWSLDGFDDELLEERDIPLGMIEEGGALLLVSETLRELGVAEGDLVGVRLTPRDWLSSGSPSLPATCYTAGAQLAATLGADEPDDVGAAVWTACVENPGLFTEPLPPLSDIVDAPASPAASWLAPSGFDFARWRFDLRCDATRPSDMTSTPTMRPRCRR